jgi:hypothetical protein
MGKTGKIKPDFMFLGSGKKKIEVHAPEGHYVLRYFDGRLPRYKKLGNDPSEALDELQKAKFQLKFKNEAKTAGYIIPTPTPVKRKSLAEDRVSELYTIFADELPEATDEARCWVVKEIHGYWDENEPDPTQKFKNRATTLSPTDPKHCVTIQEAHILIDDQVRSRAAAGFKFMRMLDMFGPPHLLFEVMPDGSYRRMPLP